MVAVIIAVLPACSVERGDHASFFPAGDESAILRESKKDFMLGVDSNYALSMRREGFKWKIGERTVDLFRLYSEQGIGWLRVRVWTGISGPSGSQYAGQLALWGQENGVNPYLVFFLSDTWADLFKQPAPAAWRNMSLAERAAAVRGYSRDTARYFRSIGVKTHLYEIGNEVDYGICGVFAGEDTDRENPDWMKEAVWKDEAAIIKACQDGIRDVDPGARFIIHLAHWWDQEFCIACFQTLSEAGVRIDYPGLSYFPTSGMGRDNTQDQFGDTVRRLTSALGRPMIVAEYAYPGSAAIPGQFSSWTEPVPGYPLNPEGQGHWLAEFLDMCYSNADIAGAFYWSPEWYATDIWQAFSLFSSSGEAKTALSALRPPAPGGD